MLNLLPRAALLVESRTSSRQCFLLAKTYLSIIQKNTIDTERDAEGRNTVGIEELIKEMLFARQDVFKYRTEKYNK